MEFLQITPLDNPALLRCAKELAAEGYLVQTADNLIALKISDDYINRLYPLLNMEHVIKPNYFNKKGGIGAHISVIYPEEDIHFDQALLGQQHAFTVDALLMAKILTKNYYILRVEAPTLLALRKQYALTEQLLFKKYYIDFHITIGTSEC